MVVAAVMAAVMVVLRAVVLSLSPRVDIHLAFGRSGNPPCAAAPQTALPFSRSNRLTSVFELSPQLLPSWSTPPLRTRRCGADTAPFSKEDGRPFWAKTAIVAVESHGNEYNASRRGGALR